MGGIAGITAEYNPFHLGHKHHIDVLKNMGYEKTVCALGGDVSQRGLPSMFSKRARTAMALACGADAVAEIPFPYSCMSAEGFANAGVITLLRMGATAISFGSESGNLSLLKSIAAFMQSDKYENIISKYLSDNLPFAIARKKAAEEEFGRDSAVLEKPNDILAVEYIKALDKMGQTADIIPVKRNRESFGDISAKEIRGLLKEDKIDEAAGFIPRQCKDIFLEEIKNGNIFIPGECYQKAILLLLKTKNTEDFLSVADCNPELANRMTKAAGICRIFSDFWEMMPTKRYTASRINRIITSVVIGAKSGFPEYPPYLRLLGFRKRSEDFISDIAVKCPVPFSASAKKLEDLGGVIRQTVRRESDACDIRTMFCKIAGKAKSDYKTGLIKI